MATTSVRVSFGSDAGAASAANAHLSAELDSRSTGLNDGKTSFVGGDTAYFLVYKSSNVALDGIPVSSAGSVGELGSVSVTKTEELIFDGNDSATLQVPANSITSFTWLGRDLGTPTLGADKITVTAPNKGVAVLEVVYSATAYPFSISSPTTLVGRTKFSISVLVLGKLV